MDPARLRALLEGVRSGAIALDRAVDELRVLPFERLGDQAQVDHQRELRTGAPEVVFGEGKTAAQIAEIMTALAGRQGRALATRVSPDKAAEVVRRLPEVHHHEVARLLTLGAPAGPRGRGEIAVVAAGTSDLPVAEEALVTLAHLGHRTSRLVDVGVAGLGRVVAAAEALRQAEVVIVVAGMEGALPAVVAGLTDRPIIAVPTSIGYGVGLGGFVAMLSMLASCAPGVMVVNIDNGFGAAIAAARIDRERGDG